MVVTVAVAVVVVVLGAVLVAVECNLFGIHGQKQLKADKADVQINGWTSITSSAAHRPVQLHHSSQQALASGGVKECSAGQHAG